MIEMMLFQKRKKLAKIVYFKIIKNKNKMENKEMIKIIYLDQERIYIKL